MTDEKKVVKLTKVVDNKATDVDNEEMTYEQAILEHLGNLTDEQKALKVAVLVVAGSLEGERTIYQYITDSNGGVGGAIQALGLLSLVQQLIVIDGE